MISAKYKLLHHLIQKFKIKIIIIVDDYQFKSTISRSILCGFDYIIINDNFIQKTSNKNHLIFKKSIYERLFKSYFSYFDTFNNVIDYFAEDDRFLIYNNKLSL